MFSAAIRNCARRAEIHHGCGGTVRLVHDAWRCARCNLICSVSVTDVATNHAKAV